MSSGLLSTFTRCMSTAYRRIASCSGKDGEKLITSPLSVFMKQNYKKAAKGSNKPMKVIAALRKQFSSLSDSQAAKYKAVAKANARKAAARRALFKQARINAYALFFKQSYAKIAKEVSGDRVQKAPLVAKQVAKQWKELGNAGRAKYAASAARLRKAAVQQRDRMIAKYERRKSFD